MALSDIAQSFGDNYRMHQFDQDDARQAMYLGQNFGDFAERNRERARQQSARNLIGQRLGEGYDWTQLGSETAQFNPELAQRMDNQFMGEATWQRNENEANLKMYREEMTRKMFSEALNAFLENGEAVTREDFMAMCQRAASRVARYDSRLAQELLVWIKQMLDTGEREKTKRDAAALKQKKGRDDEVKISDQVVSWNKNSSDPTNNPWVANINALLALSGMNVLKYKQKDKDNRWVTTSDVSAVYNWMKGKMENKDPNDPANFSKAKSILEGMSDNDVADIIESNSNEFGNVEYTNSEGVRENIVLEPTRTNNPSVNTQSPVNSASSSSSKNSTEDKLPPLAYSSKNNFYRYIPNSSAIAPIQNAIDEAQNESDLVRVYDAIGPGAHLQGEDNNVYNNLKAEADKKKAQLQKEFSDMVSEIKVGNKGQKALEKFKKYIGQRGLNARVIRPFATYASAMSQYYKTNTPLTNVGSFVLVTTPDFKNTQNDIDMTTYLKTGRLSDELWSIFGHSGSRTLAALSKQATANEMQYAAAVDATEAIREQWSGLVSDCENEEEYKEMKEMFSTILGISDETWPYIEGDVRVMTPEEKEKAKSEWRSKESEKPTLAEFKEKKDNGVTKPAASSKKVGGVLSNEELQKRLESLGGAI